MTPRRGWTLLVVTVLPLSAALAFATLPTTRPDRPADPPRADPSPTQEIS